MMWGLVLRGRAGRWLRYSPVRRFAVLSVLPLLALGLVLSTTVHQLIEDRYLSTTAESAELTVSSATTVVLSDPSLEAKVVKAGPGAFAALVDSLRGIVVYSPDGSLAYSEPGVAKPAPHTVLPAIVRSALRSGRPAAVLTDQVPPGVHLSRPAIELGIPVRQNGKTLAVALAYTSASELESGIAAGVTRANLEIGAGLLLLWLLLFPVVLNASRRLRRQALHDSLTGLANRDLFNDRLSQAMAFAARRGEKVGLLLLDLDRFKEVNDGLGHQHGDQLLRQVAVALGSTVRSTDTLARLGGDEFAIVLTGINTEEEAVAAALRMTGTLESPIVIDGVAVTPQASIGLSLFPDHGSDADTLLGKADIAMYSAKADRQSVAVYARERDFSMPARLGLVTELRRALAAEEIICHYQPLARMTDSETFGVEALVRWQHPERGLLGPGEFLPTAEQAGLMGALTERVLAVATRQGRAWLDAGLDLTVAVNLSARSLRDPSLPDMVFGILEQAGLPADRLELELTEDALLEDPDQAKTLLEALAAGGVRLSLDDFGTGYSSLAYLSHLPIAKVKIDRAFLSDRDDVMNQRIVETIIELGRRLDMQVLAEGVETPESWQRLRELGCPEAQGFFYARPMGPEQLSTWLSQRRRTHVTVG
jgi:diguanylate cyclase (GGDEF)-like protein